MMIASSLMPAPLPTPMMMRAFSAWSRSIPFGCGPGFAAFLAGAFFSAGLGAGFGVFFCWALRALSASSGVTCWVAGPPTEVYSPLSSEVLFWGLLPACGALWSMTLPLRALAGPAKRRELAAAQPSAVAVV